MISLNGNCCPFDIANWVFAPFLRLQSISAIIVIIFNFIWIIRRFWHVSSSSLQRRRKCAFLWDICLFWAVFALKVIRVMIICYPTNKLMHVCIHIWKVRLPMGTQVTMFTPTAYIIYIDNPLQEMDDLSCERGLFAPFHGIMNEEAQKSLRVHWSSTSGDIKDRPDLLINCDWYSKRGELDNSYAFHSNWQGHHFLEIIAKYEYIWYIWV